jgi:hypothetical protein
MGRALVPEYSKRSPATIEQHKSNVGLTLIDEDPSQLNVARSTATWRFLWQEVSGRLCDDQDL